MTTLRFIKSAERVSKLSGFWTIIILLVFVICAPILHAETNDAGTPEKTDAPSKFFSQDDNWLDVSGFLKEKYGFLPIAVPVTEPAVGYGAGGGLMFLSRPLPVAEDGLGRPNITVVGGLGTENGTWGAFAGNMHYWFDDRVQTFIGLIYASANLDFFGVGKDSALADNPLRYNIEPKGGTARAKYRFGDTRIWAGLSYAFTATEVSFDKPPGTPGQPAFRHESNAGGFSPSLTYDTRDNFFTPNRGTYIESSAGFFMPALGADDSFQRANLIVMQFVPLVRKLFLGVRGEATASFGDEPFYLRPFISLRGAPVLRYQGEETAQIEVELRWQFWKRFSLISFVGSGAAWNSFEQFDSTQSIPAGGAGFRYEIARDYGIHMGLDVAFGPDNAAVYVQMGSAWARP